MKFLFFSLLMTFTYSTFATNIDCGLTVTESDSDRGLPKKIYENVKNFSINIKESFRDNLSTKLTTDLEGLSNLQLRRHFYAMSIVSPIPFRSEHYSIKLGSLSRNISVPILSKLYPGVNKFPKIKFKSRLWFWPNWFRGDDARDYVSTVTPPISFQKQDKTEVYIAFKIKCTGVQNLFNN